MTRDPNRPTATGAAWAPARRVLVWAALGWTLAAAAAVMLVVHYANREQAQVARIRAEEACRGGFSFHFWNAQQGGVYVSAIPGAAREALLTNVADCELTTVSGQRLTLMNPGQLFRLVPELAPREVTWQGRLVSLKPLNPANAPDAWETQGLRRFELGEHVVAEESVVAGRPVLRYLSGLTTQPHCLKCHGQQGFQVGAGGGAVSVTVPLDFTSSFFLRPGRAASAGLIVFWLLGLAGLHRGGRELHRHLHERELTHAQLQDRERRFHTLAEQAPVGIYETDAAGQYIYVNRRWCDMAGLTPELARQAGWTQSLHAEERAAVAAAWPAHVSTGQEWQRDYRCVHPGGKVAWIHGSAVALRDEAGRITGYLGVTTDLTEGRHAAEALRESEERFRQVFEEGPLGIVLMDHEGRFLQVNKAFAAMLGCEREQLCQQSLADVSHPEDLPASSDLLRRAQAAPRQPFRLDQRYLRPSGATVWGSVTMVFIERADGQALGHLAMVQDNTDRRQDEGQLREQAALLDISPDAICVQSLAGRIEFWNPAAEKLYGWPRAEAIGALSEDRLFGRMSRELLQARIDVLTRGSWSGELQQAARDGRIIHVQSRFSLVRDAQGQPKSILIVSTDLTEKKKLEHQFLRAQRMECIGALSSGVAHDLNNVFSPILMVAELLANRPGSAADAELLTLLRTSADRGSSIVRQLLAFSRGQEIERVEMRVEHLLKEMHRLARETFPKNIQFSTQPAADLWPVIGDVTQIHQVLLNLCVNARDAMPDGGLLTLEACNFRADPVFCRMNSDAQPGPYVLLQVTDTGSGIPPAIRDKVFDPFFTTKPLGQGTGLGLPTVLGIVKAHRGFLDLHSGVGEGTRFRVFLPAMEKDAPESPLADGPAAPDGQGEQVLVVDDEEAICQVAKQVLTSHGYVPLVARDGVEAITLFAKHRADIRFVLTDMMMPGMDGAAFIRAVRKLDPIVPIVAMSGMPAQRFEADLAKHERVSFLEKPFTAENLLKAFQAFPLV
jgi:PAS domain S-box-containing protein